MTVAEAMRKMILLSDANFHDINHFLKVWAYTRTIGQCEGLDDETQAILEAETDYLMLPFVENYRYLKKLLLRCQKQESLFVRYLIQMGEMYEMRRECLRKEAHRPEVLAVLTDKEYEMVLLINQHQTNREIAEKMFLSEGSVKQYVKQIYSKLQIEGDTRTKRKQLLQLLEENS